MIFPCGTKGVGALQTKNHAHPPQYEDSIVTRKITAFNNFLVQRRCALQLDNATDPRDPRGRRYLWRSLYATTLVGMMLCARSLRTLEELSEDFGALAHGLGIPAKAGRWALGSFLQLAEPSVLLDKLHEHVRYELRNKSLAPSGLPFGVVAVDGKQDRRKLSECFSDFVQWVRPDDAKPYGLHRVIRAALVSAPVPVVLTCMEVLGKTNETASFKKLFCRLVSLFGSAFQLVTGAPAYCTAANAAQVHSANYGYLFGLKENQPTLLEEAQRVMVANARARSADAMDSGWEKDSVGRTIRRLLWVTHDMAGWPGWEHLTQVFLVRTLVQKDDGKTSVLDERFFVTNMTRGMLTAERALLVIRRHWRIENEVLAGAGVLEQNAPTAGASCRSSFFGTLDRKDLWAEDTTQGWSRKGEGLMNTSILTCIAFNLVSLFRGVHLRAEASRKAKWVRVLRWLVSAFNLPAAALCALVAAESDEQESPLPA